MKYGRSKPSKLDAPRNDLQTPEYKVVKTFESDGEKFEERAYGVDMWVCTKQIITDITSEDGMFMKLFEYITGANDRNEEIQMTSPVSTMRQKYIKGEIHEKCFYLYEKDPPKPTAEDVYLVKREAMMYTPGL